MKRWALLLLLSSCAYGYDGPWRVVENEKTEHYEVFSVPRDTITIGAESDLEPAYWQKEQALDTAYALNEAHERRTRPSPVFYDPTGKKIPPCNGASADNFKYGCYDPTNQ